MLRLSTGLDAGAWRVCRALVIAAGLAAVPALPVRAADTEVYIDNFTFTPKELAVKAGTAIVFRNRDDIPIRSLGQTARSIPRHSIQTIAFRSPSRRPTPTTIFADCIHK
jgi:hypothetical protein